MPFDFSGFFSSNLPGPAGKFGGFPKYNFVGGHNDPDGVPVDDLIAAATATLKRDGRDLSTYGMQSGPQGYKPLRRVIADLLKQRAAMELDEDEILVTSGSLQALDLVNEVMLERGDTVVIEAACYGGTMTRLARLGVNWVGVDLDENGMRMDSLRAVLADLKAKGVRPKFIYTIPTVQNPTGTIMPEDRRREMLAVAKEYDLPIFEDDCYADLIWEGDRPPAIQALDDEGRVIYCGSFSKSIAPALRVGYIVAGWEVMARLLAVKTDAGTGALEQMVLAEYGAANFNTHIDALNTRLRRKRDAIVEALAKEFGTAAEFSAPKGGIFIWVTLPDAVDTTRLAQVAGAEGVAINPGAEWVADPATGRHSLRLCFANPPVETIREGVAKLAEICHREFGVPIRGANVER
jgi:2-aminoadipate transaminase